MLIHFPSKTCSSSIRDDGRGKRFLTCCPTVMIFTLLHFLLFPHLCHDTVFLLLSKALWYTLQLWKYLINKALNCVNSWWIIKSIHVFYIIAGLSFPVFFSLVRKAVLTGFIIWIFSHIQIIWIHVVQKIIYVLFSVLSNIKYSHKW